MIVLHDLKSDDSCHLYKSLRLQSKIVNNSLAFSAPTFEPGSELDKLYGDMQRQVFEEDFHGVEEGDDPIVSSRAIHDSISNPKPRTRYPIATLSKTLAFFTSILPDRYLDLLLSSNILSYFDFCIPMLPGNEHCSEKGV